MLTDDSNIMLDLETFGIKSNAAIVSIGAVRFNGKEVTDTFYVRLDLESVLRAGMEMDASTVLWWMGQGDEARGELTSGDKVELAKALQSFSMFCKPTDKVWGNGATFDNVILSNAYQLLDLHRPWSYKNDRCYRTVSAMHPGTEFVNVGTHHNAVDDAKAQALHLIKCLGEER